MDGFIEVCGAVIRENGRILVCRRPEGSAHAGKWEFPGGKIERGESPAMCIEREMREELGIDVMPLDQVAGAKHEYSGGKKVRLHFIRCIRTDTSQPLVDRDSQTFKWIPVTEMPALDFLDADKHLASLLAAAAKDIS